MDVPPLVLSAHPSAWMAEGLRRGEPGPPGVACRFCDLDCAGWQQPYARNGDHDDRAADNLVPACPLCALGQHLWRPQIDREAALIWLPEMTQASLNGLARRIHLTCWAHKEPPHLSPRRISDAPSVVAAARVFAALLGRAGAVEQRLGVTSARTLGAALLALPAGVYAQRARLLWGARLLPRGRYFADGEDVYPEMLAAWSPTGPAPSAAPGPAPRAAPARLPRRLGLRPRPWRLTPQASGQT